MSDLHAALGVTQLALLDDLLSARRRISARYTEAFSGIDAIVPPYEPPHCRHAWQSYQVTLAEPSALGRDRLIQALLDDGIATRRGVMATHLQPPYSAGAPELPVTERVAATTLNLPIFPEMTEDEQHYVVERVVAHVTGEA